MDKSKASIWLAISLFCEKKNWHILINDAIAPFIQKMHIEGTLISFNISLNYAGGKNIRLGLYVSDDCKEILALEADEYFKSYFSKANLSVKPLSLPIDSIFMPYPANTIQYGLYKNQNNYNNMDEAISTTILQTLNDEIIDEDILITISFYLLTALTLLLKADVLNTVSIYQNIYEHGGLTIKSDTIKGQYKQAKYMLDEIYNSLQHNYDIPVWLIHWKNFCVNYISKNGPNNQHYLYNSVVNQLFIQLGFTPGMRTLLNYFILRTIQNNVNRVL